MAVIVGNNGESFLIPDGIIEEPPATEQLFDSLISLSRSLNSLSGISRTNLGSAQSTIQSANPTFNVFAVVSLQRNSESLTGSASNTGKINFGREGFVYNSSSNNKLSTGKTIVNMSGGINSSIPQIDGYKWMACAVYNGSTNGFQGILLWVFLNQVISSTGSVISGTAIVSDASSIFFPSFFSSTSNYRRIYQVVISNTGGISASNTSGDAGWLFSSGQNPNSNGYNATSRFSADDGIWAFVIGDKVNGDTPGPQYQKSGGYGFGNYNNADSSALLFWAGTNLTTSPTNYVNFVGFVFTGDA